MTPLAPPPATLHGLLRETALREPDHLALQDDQESVSFSEMWTRTGRLAALLIDSGVQAGDVVAIALPRSISMMVASFAVLRAGAIALPLDLRAPAARNRRVVDGGGARRALVPGAEAPEAVAHLTAIRLDAGWPEAPPPDPTTGAADDALLVFTSGSTGEPKGVRLSHGALVERAGVEHTAYGFSADDVYLYRVSPAFVGHSTAMAHLANGVTTVVASPEAGEDPAGLRRLIRDFRVTFAGFAPRLLEAFLAEGDFSGLDSLRILRSAGEAMPAELAGRFRAALPMCQLVDAYGTSETSGVVLSTGLSGPSAPAAEAEAGTPLPGVAIRLAGPEGEIWVSTPMLATGYVGGESGEDPRFVVDPGLDGNPPLRWYRTGDRGRLTASGRYRVLGRLDLQLNVGGVRAEPAEIERALCLHGSVAAAAVWMHPDLTGRPRLVAYLVDRGQAASSAELRSFLAGSLPAALIPTRFVRLPSLPLTPSGKVDRAALPRPESMPHSRVAARGPEEARLLPLFREVLEVRDLGVTDDFFEWGGDSLKAVSLMGLVFEATGIRLPAAVMLHASTVETLALRIAQGDPGQVMAVWLRQSGDREPLTCLPGIGADPMWMLPLMATLDPRQPLLGLSFVGLKPPIEIGGAASLGVAELRAAQPRGPYFLLGHSLGGILAFEMARELAARGDQVAFVGLLDTLVPGTRPRRLPRPPAPSREKVRAMLKRGKAMVRKLLVSAGLWPKERTRFVPPGFRQAVARHRIEPCDISVTYFRAGIHAGALDTSAAWRPLALGGMEVIDIPGHHFNMVAGANAEALSTLIAAALERARERVTASRSESSSPSM